jgi:hypothetical protein
MGLCESIWGQAVVSILGHGHGNREGSAAAMILLMVPFSRPANQNASDMAAVPLERLLPLKTAHVSCPSCLL